MNPEPILVLMAAAGLVFHFLGRWGEVWRTSAPIGPGAYVLLDPIGWASAALGAIVALILLPEIGPLVGLYATPAGAFGAGYMGSSLAAKLPGLLAPKVAGSR